MSRPGERSEHRPSGIFDVRDHYREQQVDDGLAATVPGPVRFAVEAVVTPTGRVVPRDWQLDTRRTLSGLSVFLNRVVEGRRGGVIRTLPPSATSIELRVSSPRFQTREVTLQPDVEQYKKVDLFPAVDYPFGSISTRPDQQGPSLLRGSVLDEDSFGVTDCAVVAMHGMYEYRTEVDGGFVVVLPDTLPWVVTDPGRPTRETLDVNISVTLTPTTWVTAHVLPDPGGGTSWAQSGFVMTCTVTARRGATVSVPGLRLRLS